MCVCVCEANLSPMCGVFVRFTTGGINEEVIN